MEKPVEEAEVDFLSPIVDDEQDCKKANDPEKLKQRAERGEQQFSCMASVSTKKEKLERGKGGRGKPGDIEAAFAPVPNPAADCTTTGTWWYGRKQFCLISVITVNVNEVPSGRLLGQARWRVMHSSGFDPRSATWHNPSSWTLEQAWHAGNRNWVPDVLTKAENRCTGCTGQSVGNPTAPGQRLALGQTIFGNNNLSDNPGPQVVNPNIDVHWDDFINCIACGVPVLYRWRFPLKVRCDFQTPVNGNPGCAIPAFSGAPEATWRASGTRAPAARTRRGSRTNGSSPPTRSSSPSRSLRSMAEQRFAWLDNLVEWCPLRLIFAEGRPWQDMLATGFGLDPTTAVTRSLEDQVQDPPDQPTIRAGEHQGWGYTVQT